MPAADEDAVGTRIEVRGVVARSAWAVDRLLRAPVARHAACAVSLRLGREDIPDAVRDRVVAAVCRDLRVPTPPRAAVEPPDSPDRPVVTPRNPPSHDPGLTDPAGPPA